MPIYEFKCKNGHISEILFSIKECPRTIGCLNRFCEERAEKIPSIPSPPYCAKPTTIFVNKVTGERQVAVSHYDTPPKGFVKEELKGTRERTKFEIEETQKANVVAQFETQRIKEKSNQLRKARQDGIIANMYAKQVDIHPDTGEKIEYHIDHNTEQLLKKAMKRNAEKDRIPTKVVEKRLAVNHIDSSNLVDAPK